VRAARLSALALLMMAGCPDNADNNTGNSGGNSPGNSTSGDMATRNGAEPHTAQRVEPGPTPTPNAVPFTLDFVEQPFSGTDGGAGLPPLQAFSLGRTKDGRFLVVGGRVTLGLHMFTSNEDNFPQLSSNKWLWVIDPKTGAHWSFDTTALGADLSGPLSATNAQAFQDPSSDQMLVVGGYGWAGGNMITYNTILSFPVSELAAQVASARPDAAKIKALIQHAADNRFAVTGGALKKLGNVFYLLFGQKFNGQYRAFGGSDFTQAYTEQIAQFTLKPNTLKILSWGVLTSSDADHPYHRRDGNVVDNVDPTSGAERITAFGGVFMPGKIAAYTNPIYIDPSGPTIDRKNNQRFSQYQCPVIVAYDSKAKVLYHTFFGGIGATWFSQTPSQHQAYETVAGQGRNDGFPFVADVTTYVEKSDGTFTEWILPKPTPQNQLLGASVDFIIDNDLVASGAATAKGVLHLDKWKTGEKKLIGYVFGGIQAQNPLPLVPNSGTQASNALLQAYLTLTPEAAYPASDGHAAVQSAGLKLK
jgi:hypothetical protein